MQNSGMNISILKAILVNRSIRNEFVEALIKINEDYCWLRGICCIIFAIIEGNVLTYNESVVPVVLFIG